MLLTIFNKDGKYMGHYKIDRGTYILVEERCKKCLGLFDKNIKNYNTLIESLHSIMLSEEDICHYKVEFL